MSGPAPDLLIASDSKVTARLVHDLLALYRQSREIQHQPHGTLVARIPS